MKDEIVWFKPNWFPIEYGFCPSPEAWNKEMERMKLSIPYPLGGNDDGCTIIFEKNNCDCKIIVCLNPYPDWISFVGLVVHEAAHVWQHILETIEEDKPSTEFEAYGLQGITQDLLIAAKECGFLLIDYK